MTARARNRTRVNLSVTYVPSGEEDQQYLLAQWTRDAERDRHRQRRERKALDARRGGR